MPRSEGFSLIEVLVALVLLGVLAAGFSTVFQGNLHLQLQVESAPEQLEERRSDLNRYFSGQHDEEEDPPLRIEKREAQTTLP